jgi:hypothetical protein
MAREMQRARKGGLGTIGRRGEELTRVHESKITERPREKGEEVKLGEAYTLGLSSPSSI